MSYQLRHHPRARRLRLRIERDGALVVTAPRRVARKTIDRFVDSKRDWIEGVRRRLAEERGGRDPAVSGSRPERIELPAIDERWWVGYRAVRCARRIEQDIGHRRLVLKGDEDDGDIAAALQGWLKARARQTLAPWLDSLSDRYGIAYERVSFRNQRSRWGSCSTTGNLSINARLLFASPEACRYVLVHELAHIEHPNHSPAFWRRVATMDPAYRDHSKELRALGRRLPDWV